MEQIGTPRAKIKENSEQDFEKVLNRNEIYDIEI